MIEKKKESFFDLQRLKLNAEFFKVNSLGFWQRQ
jgi:hypothetical protein